MNRNAAPQGEDAGLLGRAEGPEGPFACFGLPSLSTVTQRGINNRDKQYGTNETEPDPAATDKARKKLSGRFGCWGACVGELPLAPFKRTRESHEDSFSLSAHLSGPTHSLLYVVWIALMAAGPPVVFILAVPHNVLTTLSHHWSRWVLLALLLYPLAWIILETFFICTLCCVTCWRRSSRGEKPIANAGIDYPPATAVIVAYLPNEADIILDTLQYFHKLQYSNKLQVILAYNTPKDMPEVELEFAKLGKTWPRFKAVRVAGSTSKCDNINSILDSIEGEFVGMFDSDHNPQDGAFELAWQSLAQGYDCVQGRTQVHPRYANSVVSRFLQSEYEIRHALTHWLRSALYAYSIFAGAGGYWRTHTLQTVGMDGSQLTEDVDSAWRAQVYGYKVVYNHDIRSLEQPPPTLAALTKQRLRWAQGWYQTTYRSLMPMLTSGNLSLRQKIGMLFGMNNILSTFLPYAVFFFIWMGVIPLILSLTVAWWIPPVCLLVLLLCYIAVLWIVADAPCTSKVVYTILLLPFLILSRVIDTMAQVRFMIGFTGWYVTARVASKDPKVDHGKPPAPESEDGALAEEKVLGPAVHVEVDRVVVDEKVADCKTTDEKLLDQKVVGSVTDEETSLLSKPAESSSSSSSTWWW